MKKGFPKEEDSVPSPPDDAANGKPPFSPASPCTGDYKGRARVLTRWTKKSGSSQKTNHQIKKQGEDSTRNYGCERTIETSSSLSLTSDTLPSSGHSASRSTISNLPSDDAPQSIDQGLHESLSSLGSTCDGNIFSDDDDQPQKKDTKNSGAIAGPKRNDGNDKAGSPRYRGSVSNYFHSGCNVLPKAIGMFNEDDLNVPEPVRSIHPNFGGASSFSQPHPKPPLIFPPAHRVPTANKTTIVMHFSAKINNDNAQDDTSQERSPVNEAKHGSETSHNSSEEPASQQHVENYPALLEDADTEHTRNTREEVTQNRPNRNNLQEALLGSVRSRDALIQARATNDSPNAGERTPTSGQSYRPTPRQNPTSRPSMDATYTAAVRIIPTSDEGQHVLPTSTNSSSSTEVTGTNQSAFRPHYSRQSSADRGDFDSHEIRPSGEYARRYSLPSQSTAYFQQGLPLRRGSNPTVAATSTSMADQSALPPMHHHHQQRQHSAERALLQRQQGQLELQEQRRQAAAALDPHAEVFIQIPQGQGQQGNTMQVPLRRAHEVQSALEQDFYETPVCPCCSRRLAVIADAAYLYCPICTEISPLRGNIIAVGDFREEPEYLRRGLGLGMTWETLKKVHQEMFPQEYKNKRR